MRKREKLSEEELERRFYDRILYSVILYQRRLLLSIKKPKSFPSFGHMFLFSMRTPPSLPSAFSRHQKRFVLPDSFHEILIPSFILNETNARKPCFLAKICTCPPFFCIIKAFVTLPSHLRARKEPPCRKSLRTKKKKAIVLFCWIRALASL